MTKVKNITFRNGTAIYSPDFSRSYTEDEAKKLIADGTHKYRTPAEQPSKRPVIELLKPFFEVEYLEEK